MYLPTCACNEDSNHPAPPRSLIRVVAVRITKLGIHGYPKCAKWRFWSDCANAQADLNLCWAYISEGTFPKVTVLLTELYNTIFIPIRHYIFYVVCDLQICSLSNIGPDAICQKYQINVINLSVRHTHIIWLFWCIDVLHLWDRFLRSRQSATVVEDWQNLTCVYFCNLADKYLFLVV